MNKLEKADYVWSNEERMIIAAACEYGNMNYDTLANAYLDTPSDKKPYVLGKLRDMVQGIKAGNIVPFPLTQEEVVDYLNSQYKKAKENNDSENIGK